ncbi:HlyD family efflux transporter periplasmic adaptor subunit [Alkalimarinus coralli]|uniref:HlyD family efflux transporter periplasmic adaptor subunit n=1 Tax=Alkalimarinus coralli TaxID=2935863 RepID=UPI00202B15F3|nr:HlyD family efflux transporter periplasmic adaptor subunit [Alkalimarinus coralli]
MSDSLFRKEVIENQRERLWGDLVISQPLSYYVLSAVAILFAILLITLLFMGSYARKESVKGYLAPDLGLVKLYAPREGVYAQVHIKQGQKVEEGQILFTVVDETVLSSGDDIDSVILQQLNKEEAVIDARIERETLRVSSEEKRLKALIQGAHGEIKQLIEQQRIQKERLLLSEKQYKAMKLLADDALVSETRYQEQYERHLTDRQQAADISRQLLSRQNDLRVTEFELEQLPENSAERVAELETRKIDLVKRRTEIDGRRSFTVRAPVNGRISSLQISAGQAVVPNKPILDILPEGAQLQAELFVPSRAIGFISTQQSVKLQYQAFPYQRFGIYDGTVMKVTESILSPSDIPSLLRLQEPVYRISVELDEQTVSAYGKALPLQAGMLLDADIIVDSRTLVEWILDPLYSLQGVL